MCGIAAIFAYSQSAPGVEEGELVAIRDQMRLRGPDGFGSWLDPRRRIGLGHRRLSIIDLSPAGAQPMFSADGRSAVVFNGEIYNYRELRTELEAKGSRFRSTSDTEVLLHLYQAEGEEMVRRLRGMFAFALWDDVRRGLFLARDPYGIKPLYFADDGKTLRAASQLKALLTGGKIGTAPDPAGHVGFFLWGHVPEPYTMYRGIRSLPAGTSLWVGEEGGQRQRTYCSIPQILAAAGSQTSDVGRPISGVRPSPSDLLASALRDSVAHHLIADVPVGVFLSSGLDSTTLAALAAEQGGALQTVTLGFEEYRGTSNDETPLAELVARQYGALHQTRWVSRQDFTAAIEPLFAAMDQPTTDGVNTYFVSQITRAAGLKVALSGLGGDELFGGYPSFREIPRVVNALGFLPPENGLGKMLRAVSAPVLKQFTSPKYAGLLEYGGGYGGAYLLRRGMFMPWELPEILEPDLVREGWAELQPILRLEETIKGVREPHAKVSCLESCWYMRNQLLRDADWAGMAHSLEIRVPLVDTALLQSLATTLASATPPTKHDMALTPRVPLPAFILDRPKTGFTIPVRDWLTDAEQKAERGKGKARARGLRGWAREVYAQLVPEKDQVRCLVRNRRLRKTSRRGALADILTSSVSPSRILVFRIGQLGDTIVSLPALWVVRQQYPDAHITLLCDRQADRNYVLAGDLLRGSTLVDAVESYPFDSSVSGRLMRPVSMAAMLLRMRTGDYDTVVYLAPSTRTPTQTQRDYHFFRAMGIKNFVGLAHIDHRLADGAPQIILPYEADLLLERLASSGLPVPTSGRGCMDLQLSVRETGEVRAWLSGLGGDGGKLWIGVGPGSKMPAKRWSASRYAEVVAQLIRDYNVWPVVFGGREDSKVAEQLLSGWGRGYNAAGALGVRAAAAALGRCALYLGNDTGTMHLAAAVGTPCVAVFSARAQPGLWYPYGNLHRVFRANIECQNCGLVECVERKNECLNRISTAQVLSGCQVVLDAQSSAMAGNGLLATNN